MPTIVWILLWVAVIGTIAFFAVREVRSGRKAPNDFDRHEHQAVRAAGIRADMQGPNGPSSRFSG